MSTPNPTPAQNIIQTHLQRLLSARTYPKTLCPSEIARAFTAAELQQATVTNWRELMPEIRREVWGMRDGGEVDILQRGEVLGDEVGLEDVRGPVRVRRRGD